VCVYNLFQNKKDFDGDQDIAPNYPPRYGSVIPLSICHHAIFPTRWSRTLGALKAMVLILLCYI